MSQDVSLDIDTEIDFKFCEFLMKKTIGVRVVK